MITNEQLAEIKDYCAKATPGPWEAPQQRLMEEQTIYGAWKKEDAEFITNARTDLPLLVAECERLREQLWVGQGVHNAACDDLMRTRGDLSAAQKDVAQLMLDVAAEKDQLSAAQKRIEELEGLVVDATVALRLLHDHQNGCPLPKYEEHWNEAMRLTELVLPKLEALTTPPQ